MELTATQTLAAWIVFSQNSGKDGPMFPPREALEQIVARKAGRYEEAEGMAKHFLEKVMCAPPATVGDTLAAGARFVQGLDKRLGGLLGTPPVRRVGKIR